MRYHKFCSNIFSNILPPGFRLEKIGEAQNAPQPTCENSSVNATWLLSKRNRSKHFLSNCTGCEFRSIDRCKPPRLQAIGKDTIGNTTLYVCATENNRNLLPFPGIRSCDILGAEVLSSGVWKVVNPVGGIENVLRVEVSSSRMLGLKVREKSLVFIWSLTITGSLESLKRKIVHDRRRSPDRWKVFPYNRWRSLAVYFQRSNDRKQSYGN